MIQSDQIGIGLRPAYYADLVTGQMPIDWLEVVSDDYFSAGGLDVAALEKIRSHYPIVMHGVGLSLGSADPLSWDYLHQLKQLQDRIEPEWVSDHLCWTGVDGWSSHDLLPLPRTEAVLKHLIARVHVVQQFLNRPLVLENVTAYVDYAENTMSEWEFLTALSDATDCYFLLDVNNLYVNAMNRGEDPQTCLKNYPWRRIQQYHMAGHEKAPQGFLLDTHRSPLSESVCDLMAACWEKQPAPILLERDDHLPDLADLWQEAASLKHRLPMTDRKETDDLKKNTAGMEKIIV